MLVSLYSPIKMIHSPINIKYTMYLTLKEGRDSSVGIATGYGLHGPGIECRCGRDFLHLYRTALGPTQPPIQWILDIFHGGKVAGA